MITLLCKPENELSAAIPSANPAKTLQGSEVSVLWLLTKTIKKKNIKEKKRFNSYLKIYKY